MRPAGRERGIIVLMLLVVLALTAASALLLTDLNANRATPAAVARQTATALAEARGALLGYAAAYPDRAGVNSRTAGPGLLPIHNSGERKEYVLDRAWYTAMAKFPRVRVWPLLDE